MPRFHHAQNNFTGGEISPRMSGAVNTSVYQSGLSRCTNFLVLPQGGAYRRLGSVFQGEAMGEDSCLITFEDDVRDYVVELSQGRIRVWLGPLVVLDEAAPWLSGDLFEIQACQDGNELFMFHRNVPPQVLERVGNTFSLSPLSILDVPEYHFEDADAAVGQVQNLSVLDDANWVDGDFFRLVVNSVESEKIYYTSDTDLMASRILQGIKPLVLVGGFGLTRGLEVTNVSTAPATYDITYGDGIKGLTWLIQPGAGEAVAAAAAISIAVTTQAEGLEFESAWSATRGYPGACCFYGERLWAGGTDLIPQTLWGSRVGSSNDWKAGPNDGDAVSFKLKSQKRVSIQWMSGKRGLAIGTTGGDWIVPQQVQVITPSNIAFARQTTQRSARRRPVEVDGETFYLQSGGKKVRQFIYERGVESWRSLDLSYFSQHITGSGLKQVCYTDHPDSIVWGVTNEGVLTGMTYERLREVLAWHKHTTDGVIRSVTTAHNAGVDELCIVVSRKNGTFYECIPFTTQDYYRQDSVAGIGEEFDPEEIPFAPRVKVRAFDAFMDSAQLSTNVSEVNAPHLKGQEVAVLADDAVLEGLSADANGMIALDDVYERVWVGLPYSAAFKMLPIEVPSQSGTSQSMRVRYVKPSLRLADSQLPMVGGERPADRDNDTLFDSPEELFTGDIDVANWGQDRGQVQVEADLPLPCHVVMLYGWVEMGVE